LKINKPIHRFMESGLFLAGLPGEHETRSRRRLPAEASAQAGETALISLFRGARWRGLTSAATRSMKSNQSGGATPMRFGV